MKSVSEVVDIIQQQLRQLNSSLAEFGKTSNLYIFFRSIASIISEQFYLLEVSKLQNDVRTATGENLDIKASEFGLTRKPGNFGEGWILAKSLNQKIRIPKDTILSSVEGNFQFKTLGAVEIDLFEIAIPVQSLLLSEAVNISAGTELFSPFFPQAQFEVGKFREVSTQKAQAGIQKGQSAESDSVFRARIINYINGLSKIGSLNNIISQIESFPFISKVFIEEHFPVAGYFTAYLNTQKAEEISQVERLLNEIKPLGVNFTIKPIKEVAIDLNLSIQLIAETNSDFVLNQIRSGVFQYFQNLDLNQNLDPAVVRAIVLKVLEVKDAQIDSPTDIVIPPDGGLIVLRNLNIKLNI